MEELKNALWEDYKEANSKIKDLQVGSNEYKDALEDRDNIRNEMIKIEQIKSENDREKIRNWITIGTFGISIIYGGWKVWKTFKFDEVATVTSTLGRNILNGDLPKLFKR